MYFNIVVFLGLTDIVLLWLATEFNNLILVLKKRYVANNPIIKPSGLRNNREISLKATGTTKIELSGLNRIKNNNKKKSWIIIIV